jgi:prevent-host-death family protein
MTDKQVGIRALKQNASEVLEMVKQGNRVIVTDRGNPIAQITPYKKSKFDEMVEGGLIIPAAGPLFVPEIPQYVPGLPTIQEMLDEQRAERHF